MISSYSPGQSPLVLALLLATFVHPAGASTGTPSAACNAAENSRNIEGSAACGAPARANDPRIARAGDAPQPHAADASNGRDDHEEDDHDADAPEGDEHGHHDRESSSLSVKALEHGGVTFTEADSGHVDDGVELLGTARPNGDHLAHITPRFPGIVREVRANVGDNVKAGAVLAVIESSESLSTYELKTLIDGTIIAKHLTRGEAVDREKQAFVIADLSTVWVNLSIYQKDIERVRVGELVHVKASQESAVAEGTITYLTPGLDDRTRTATARVVLPNPDRRWRPGMFVVAYVLSPHPAGVVVPSSAIQTLEGQTVVFVAEGDQVEPRPVVLGHRGKTVVEIVSGLRTGERVAATNTFLLKAELGKSEAEHDH